MIYFSRIAEIFNNFLFEKIKENTSFFIGSVMGIAILWPYLGRFVDLGFHSRAWSLSVLFICFVFSFRKNKIFFQIKDVDLLLSLLLFSICSYYSSTVQLKELFNPSIDGEYFSRKLAILFYAAILPAFFVKLIVNNNTSISFYKGLLFGFFLTTIIGLIVLCKYWDYIYLADNLTARELRNLNVVSTIGLSLVFSVGFLFLIIKKHTNEYVFYLQISYAILILFLIVVLRQRTHIVILLVGMTLFFRSYLTLKAISLICFLALIALIIFNNMSTTEGYNSILFKHWQTALDGEIFKTRLPYYEAALKGIFNDMGHGFASFSLDYPRLVYPHNILLEAFYEMGWFGGLTMTLIIYNILLSCKRLFSLDCGIVIENNLRYIYILFLTFMLIHHFKAGGIESMGLLLISWFIANGYYNRQKICFLNSVRVN